MLGSIKHSSAEVSLQYQHKMNNMLSYTYVYNWYWCCGISTYPMGTSRVLNPRYWCQYLILVSVQGLDIGIGICASLVLHIRQILSYIPQISQTVKNTNSKVRVWQKCSALLSTFREHPCVLVYERKELRFCSSLLNVQWKLWHSRPSCIYVYYSHSSRDVLAYFTRSAIGLSAFKISDLIFWVFL